MAICPRGHESIADDFCDACGRPIAPRSTGHSGPQQYGTRPEPVAYPQGPVELCPVCRTPRNGDARYCEACGHEFGTTPSYQAAPDPGGYGYGAQSGYGTYTDPGAGHGGHADPHPGHGRSGHTGQSGHGAHTGHGGYAPYAPPADPAAGYPPAPPTYPGDDYGLGGGTVIGSGPVEVPPRPPATPHHPAGPAPDPHRYVWSVVVTADHDYFQRVVAQGGPDAHAMRFPPYHESWDVQLYGTRMRVGRRRAGETTSGGPEIDLSGPPSDPGISHLHVVLMARPDGTWSLVDPGSTNGTTMNGAKQSIEVNVPIDLQDGDRIHVGAWTTLEVRYGMR